MSFASNTKKELCKVECSQIEEQKAEAYGFLLFIKKFSNEKIVFSTENPYVANRFIELLSNVWQVITEKKTALTGKRNSAHLYTVSVPYKEDCSKIFKDLGHSSKDLSLRINRANIDEDYLQPHFLRGVFLCCGTITNPEKEYHLEFVISYQNLCNDLCKVISDINVLPNDIKTITRKGNYTAYMKDSEQISDFLALIEAPLASIEIINTKILKNMRNNINRKSNFEIANLDRIVSVSVVQINAIQKIKDTKGLDFLPEELKQVAILRLEHSEYSLRDIGELLAPPISRSGVNHRMKKIMEIAKECE